MSEPPWTLHHADLRDILPTLADKSVDHAITDAPYSETVHQSVRSAKRNEAADVDEFECRTRRVVDLGFDHLSASLRRFCAKEFARVARRWVMAFSDAESCHLWRRSFEAAGLEYARTMAWVRIGGAPQFSGDKPSAGFEAITVAHQKNRRGRKDWNGGGKAGIYAHPIVANRLGQRGSRVHPTQKPESLMAELIEDFTNPGDLILDPFAGSATTGVVAVRLGRRFIGIEQKREHYETARDRLEAECAGSTLAAHRAGQVPMFGTK